MGQVCFSVLCPYKYLAITLVTLCGISPLSNSDWICFWLTILLQMFAAAISCRESVLTLEAFSISSFCEEVCLRRWSTFSSLLRMCMLGWDISNLFSIKLSFHLLKRTDFSQFQICVRESFRLWLARPLIVDMCHVSNIVPRWSLLRLILLAHKTLFGLGCKFKGIIYSLLVNTPSFSVLVLRPEVYIIILMRTLPNFVVKNVHNLDLKL